MSLATGGAAVNGAGTYLATAIRLDRSQSVDLTNRLKDTDTFIQYEGQTINIKTAINMGILDIQAGTLVELLGPGAAQWR